MDVNGFGDLGLSHNVLKDLEHNGFVKPMPIQAEAIPVLLEGRDFIGEAKTGTGKTLAFAIPIIEKIDCSMNHVQALILAPTRELANQVSGEMRKVGYRKHVKTLAVYGGKSISGQAKMLGKGVHVVVGTPGRLIDLVNRRILNLSRVNMLVLDEADRMLDMGFIHDIRKIISYVPGKRQTMLFSATMPREINDLASSVTVNPKIISISSDELTVDEVEQCYYETSQTKKLDVFVKVLRTERPDSAIIFCNTKRWADTLGRLMKQRNLHGEVLHGDLSQNMRDRVMDGFRRKRFRFLIATDVAARGLDIDDVSHVFNYDLPKDPGSYVHRIGRTGRAGKGGKAISFISPREIHGLWDIEHRCRTKIREADLDSLNT